MCNCTSGNLVQLRLDSGPIASRCPWNDRHALRPGALVADAQQFHRPVRYHDPEGGADGPLDQMDFAAMGANQFGGDGKPEPAATRPSRGLERLEQMIARLLGHAGAGVGNLADPAPPPA